MQRLSKSLQKYMSKSHQDALLPLHYSRYGSRDVFWRLSEACLLCVTIENWLTDLFFTKSELCVVLDFTCNTNTIMTVVLVRIHQYLCTPHFSVCFSLSYRHLLPPAPTRDQTTFGRNSNGCLPRIRKIKRGVCMARAKQKHEISFHLNDLRHGLPDLSHVLVC